MSRSRLWILLVPLALGLASAAGPGRAQTAADPRFAFADTTLLRDTLDLEFSRLFELADSLGIRPDTLRALSIRYGFVPLRMVALAESMRVRVDSVGVVLLREQFSVMVARGERLTNFEYQTGYTMQQNQNTWKNIGTFYMTRGQMFLRNVTDVSIQRFTTQARTTERLTRKSETEVGWRLNPDASVGGRAVLDRFDSDDPSTITEVRSARNDYQISLRTRQRPRNGLATELNAFTGFLDLDDVQQVKRGGTGEVNGKLLYSSGDWMTTDVSGQVTGNLARISLKKLLTYQDTHDFGQSYRGNLTLFPAGRLGFVGDITYRDFSVQSADDSAIVRTTVNASTDVTMTLQGRADNDRQITIVQAFNTQDFATAQASSQSNRSGSNSRADLRYRLGSTSIEGSFSLDFADGRSPALSAEGGYSEKLEGRQLEGSLSRQLATHILGRASATISLSSFRYSSIGTYPTLPADRDQAQQNYRLEAAYNPGSFNTSLKLEVGRTELVNLTPTTVTANNVLRTYRGDWTWTYRLFSRLTATQRNGIAASYTNYPFNPNSDRLVLDYTTTTTLNAVLTRRLSVDLTHNGQEQPSGNYLNRADLGGSYFLPADETRTYQLGARVSYTPAPGVTLLIEPRYLASDRLGTDPNGSQVPARENRNLTFTGGLNLNIKVGRKGRLTGNVGRQFQSNGTQSFSNGVPQPESVSEFDYWTGNLQFTWNLR